jgi:hypothetical protein
VRHQPPGLDVRSETCHGRQTVLELEIGQPPSMREGHGIGENDHRLGAPRIDIGEPGCPFDAGWAAAEGRIAERLRPARR